MSSTVPIRISAAPSKLLVDIFNKFSFQSGTTQTSRNYEFSQQKFAESFSNNMKRGRNVSAIFQKDSPILGILTAGEGECKKKPDKEVLNDRN